MPNGVVTTQEYDGLDRLARLKHAKGANTIADNLYQYNAASQMTQIAEPTRTRNFSYDAADRLTAVQNPTQTVESYAYDVVGNRTASHQSSTYAYQSFNKVVTIGSNSYSYDSNGNLTSKTDASGVWLYNWDYENRLKQVTRPDSTIISYKYDALGRRVQRTPGSGVSTNYVYDGEDVVKDINSDGSTVEYLNGEEIDNKIRQTSSTSTLYFSQDHLGSTRALTDSSGNVVESVNYDSFGNGASTLTRYGYTGREWDAEANLYYYRARWYDAQVGRFISEDPIGLEGGINLYTYVGNDPVSFNDPSGLQQVGSGFRPGNYPAAPPPLYPDNYDWWAAFKAEWWERAYQRRAWLERQADRILCDPGVQFALAGLGPLGSIAADLGLAAKASVGVQSISPSAIRFSQSSVNGVNRIATSMRAGGWSGAPVDIVRMSDGTLVTLDNTRVLAAHQAGIRVQAIIREGSSKLPTEFIQRFTTRRGGVPQTWADAVLNRIGSQNSQFRSTYPNGSPFTGAN